MTRDEAAGPRGHTPLMPGSWLLIESTVSEGDIRGAGSPPGTPGGPAAERKWSAQDPKKVAQRPHSGPKCPYWFQTKSNDFRDISRAAQERC